MADDRLSRRPRGLHGLGAPVRCALPAAAYLARLRLRRHLTHACTDSSQEPAWQTRQTKP
ncbi:protein of unknown function [Paraburkholderia kururiensis]